MRTNHLPLCILCIVIILAGCQTPEECVGRPVYHIRVAFYDNNKAVANLDIDSVVVVGKRLTYKMIVPEPVPQLTLPVDIDTNASTFLMYKASTHQQLHLRYQRQLARPNERCGTELRVTLTEIVAHDFTDAVLVARHLFPTDSIHVEVTL